MVQKGGSTPATVASSGSSLGSRIKVIVIVVVMILVLVSLWNYSMYLLDEQTPDVEMSVQISGNDIVVVLFTSENARNIYALHAYIEGIIDRAHAQTCDDITVETPIIFRGMAQGVSGPQFVIIEATFKDGTRNIVKYSRIFFS